MRRTVTAILIFIIWISIAFPLAPVVFDNVQNVLNSSGFGKVVINYKQPKVVTINNTTRVEYENGTLVYDFQPIIFFIIVVIYYLLPIVYILKKVI